MSLSVRAAGVYRPVYVDNLFRRVDGVYVKYNELKVKNSGGYRSVWKENVAPPAPTNLYWTSENGGVFNLYWAWAANSDDDYNRVEVQEVGDVGRISTDYPETYQRRSGYEHAQLVHLQIRAIDDGGLASPWTSFSAATSLYVHPGMPTMQSATWNGSGFTVNWLDGDNAYGDIMYSRLSYKAQAESTWTTLPPEPASGGHSVNAPVRVWDANHFFYVETFTSWATVGSTTLNAWSPPQPGTEKIINAYSADSYAYTANTWLNDGKARHGQFAPTPYGLHFGAFFYDNLLYNASHGHPAVSGDIFMIRDGDQGFPGTVYFESHAYRSRPAAVPSTSGVQWPSTNQFASTDAGAFEALPASFLNSVAAGVTKGVGIYISSSAQSHYRVFKGPSTNGQAGMIRLRW